VLLAAVLLKIVDVHMKHLLKEQMQEDYNILNSLKKLNLSS